MCLGWKKSSRICQFLKLHEESYELMILLLWLLFSFIEYMILTSIFNLWSHQNTSGGFSYIYELYIDGIDWITLHKFLIHILCTWHSLDNFIVSPWGSDQFISKQIYIHFKINVTKKIQNNLKSHFDLICFRTSNINGNWRDENLTISLGAARSLPCIICKDTSICYLFVVALSTPHVLSITSVRWIHFVCY